MDGVLSPSHTYHNGCGVAVRYFLRSKLMASLGLLHAAHTGSRVHGSAYVPTLHTVAMTWVVQEGEDARERGRMGEITLRAFRVYMPICLSSPRRTKKYTARQPIYGKPISYRHRSRPASVALPLLAYRFLLRRQTFISAVYT